MDMALVSAGYSAATSMINAYLGNSAAKYQAEVANKIRDGNNKVLEVVNQRDATITGLQRWRQQVNNSRVHQAVANSQEALAVNFNRQRDAKTRANFATNIRAAEESGRQQAAAAASGVTGSVVDVIDRTSRMRQGMEAAAVQAAEGQMTYDYAKQEFAQKWATLDTLDNSLIFDNISLMDTKRDVAQTRSVLMAGITAPGVIQNTLEGAANFAFSQRSSGAMGMLDPNE